MERLTMFTILRKQWVLAALVGLVSLSASAENRSFSCAADSDQSTYYVQVNGSTATMADYTPGATPDGRSVNYFFLLRASTSRGMLFTDAANEYGLEVMFDGRNGTYISFSVGGLYAFRGLRCGAVPSGRG